MGQRIRKQEGASGDAGGRDELNLAEFPIAVLSSRPNKAIKTIHFEDRIWDKRRGGWITRRLTVAASDKYGLPTALDDEVILGLIQITRKAGFESRQVFFSRYRLLRTLGWRNEGKSYTRLETSLKRWLGVTFYYENAWWDKASQSWVDENFHILEQVSVFDRNRLIGRRGTGELPLSVFTWNEAVFSSFRAGYLKQIDMELFRQLRSPVAKRLYRLLDKRFYHRGQWDFDLRELACEHVGLSRTYDTGQLKRKLRPAIDELEAVGYLRPAGGEGRFLRVGRGHWQVSLARATRPRHAWAAEDTRAGVRSRLLQRGVNPATAARLVSEHPADEIDRRIAAFDWILNQDPRRVPRNPAGYLVQSIREGYGVPPGFSPPKGDCCESVEGPKTRITKCQRRPRGMPNHESLQVRVKRYLRSLDPLARQRLEERAIGQADAVLLATYKRALAQGAEALAAVYRHLILERHLESRLGPAPPRNKG